MVHRFAAALIGLLMIHTLVGFRQGHRPPDVRLLSVAVAALFLAQVMVGAATVWLKFPAEIRALHLGMATAVWVAIAALAALSFTGQRLPGNEPAHA
jgi:heme A synthase